MVYVLLKMREKRQQHSQLPLNQYHHLG